MNTLSIEQGLSEESVNISISHIEIGEEDVPTSNQNYSRVVRMSNSSRQASDPLSPNMPVEEKASVSRVKKAAGIYSFRIEGYSGLSAKVGDSTESPEFDLCGHLWQLRIFPGGSLEAHRTYVSYYLASKSTRSAKASYKLSVCSQVPGGADECFASSGVRLFEAKGLQIDGKNLVYRY